MLAQGHPLLADCSERLDTISSTPVTNSKRSVDSAVSTEEAASEPEVLVEQRDRILIITINRPKAKNAVNAAVSRVWPTRWTGSTKTRASRWAS